MILVTGASGLLGANFLSLANEQGREAIGFYHCHPVHLSGVKLVRADLTDPVETERILQELSPAQVVHCAPATDVDWCEAHPKEAECVNVAAPAAIADFTSRAGTRLVYISTDSV